MPKICYEEKNFRQDSLDKINIINSIVDEYQNAGYELTLRQLYYQLVARDYIPNNQRSYKNIGNLINDGRLAGLIDWYSIVDRTRFVRKLPHWNSPDEIIESCANQFHTDWWEIQSNYVEVWVEKDALIDIVHQACRKFDVPCFSCRGYVSQSEMWNASQRLAGKMLYDNKDVTVIHLGDHDPSGIDMTRDITERLNLFLEPEGVLHKFAGVKRIALSMEQIERYAPPPNPAKITDTRAYNYIKKYGYESWELDALEPKILTELIQNEILGYLDTDEFLGAQKSEKIHKENLRSISEKYYTIVDKIRGEEL